jgi:lipopolysaccharide transport system ATP-binding protein
LLEVGTGFHPDLTGRENVFLNGAILGMRRAEIVRKFEEIVAFAGVEQFIDTPVKRYSSGMYLRLAFAVAAHLEPDILIVDEVLAVGDASFQKKCLGKMHNVSSGGRTVLFVSHNMHAVGSLCDRVIWLESGRIQKDGEAREVATEYLRTITAAEPEACWDADNGPGCDSVRMTLVRVIGPSVSRKCNITIQDPFRIQFGYSNLQSRQVLNISFSVYNANGVCVFYGMSPAGPRPLGLNYETCEVPGHVLNEGTYWIEVSGMKEGSVLFTASDVCLFNVYEQTRDSHWHANWPGVTRPNLRWEWTCDDQNAERALLPQAVE